MTIKVLAVLCWVTVHFFMGFPCLNKLCIQPELLEINEWKCDNIVSSSLFTAMDCITNIIMAYLVPLQYLSNWSCFSLYFPHLNTLHTHQSSFTVNIYMNSRTLDFQTRHCLKSHTASTSLLFPHGASWWPPSSMVQFWCSPGSCRSL